MADGRRYDIVAGLLSVPFTEHLLDRCQILLGQRLLRRGVDGIFTRRLVREIPISQRVQLALYGIDRKRLIGSDGQLGSGSEINTQIQKTVMPCHTENTQNDSQSQNPAGRQNELPGVADIIHSPFHAEIELLLSFRNVRNLCLLHAEHLRTIMENAGIGDQRQQKFCKADIDQQRHEGCDH